MIVIAFFYISILLIYIYIFITGFHDEGNLIATIISSRSLGAAFIFILAFFSQFFGTLLLGTKVAQGTIYGLFNVSFVRENSNEIALMISASMLGAIIWDIITWVGGIPSSSSHAVIGGLLGPFIMKFGFSVVNAKGIFLVVLIPLFTSPIIGFFFGYLIFKLNQNIFCGYSVKIKSLLRGLQVSTCILINAFQGSNDAQKGMGILALLLMINGNTSAFVISKNIVLSSALTIALGLVLGGMKMIKSVGTKIYSVKIIHSMSAQTASLFVIVIASVFGFPVSGTQIINSSIFGVGAADRPNAVGWSYAKDMLTAWLITIPFSFLLSSGFYYVFHCIGG